MESDNKIEVEDPQISPETHNIKLFSILIKLGIDKERSEFAARLRETMTVVDDI